MIAALLDRGQSVLIEPQNNPLMREWVMLTVRERGPIRLVPLGVSELIIRMAMHPEWVFLPLQLPTGVEPL